MARARRKWTSGKKKIVELHSFKKSLPCVERGSKYPLLNSKSLFFYLRELKPIYIVSPSQILLSK